MGGQVRVAPDSPGAKYCSICNAYHPGEPCFKPTEAQRGEAVAIMMRYKTIDYVSLLTGKTVTQLQRWLMVYEGQNSKTVQPKDTKTKRSVQHDVRPARPSKPGKKHHPVKKSRAKRNRNR